MANQIPLLGVAGPVVAGGGNDFLTNLWAYWIFEGGTLPGDGDDLNGDATHDFDVERGATGVIDNVNGADTEDCSEFGSSGISNFEITSVGADHTGFSSKTLAGWVLFDTVASDEMCMLCVWDTGGADGSSLAFAFTAVGDGSNRELRGYVGNSSDTKATLEGIYETTDAANLAANTWYHVGMTYDAGTITLYVNGSAEASTTTGTIPTSSNTRVSALAEVEAGSAYSLAQWGLDGRLNHWSIWDRVFTSGNMSTHYNGGSVLKYASYG